MGSVRHRRDAYSRAAVEGGGVEPPQFLAKDEAALTLSLIMGLQHALAMVAGIATSGGMLIAATPASGWQQDSEMCESFEGLVSAA